MSLQSYAETAIRKDGVYDVMWYFDKLLLVSLSDEDTNHGGGKAEGDLWLDNELITLTSAMFSVISGGVKTAQGETPRAAIQREVKQEVDLDLAAGEFHALNLPQTRTIQQRKGNGTYDIHGVGYTTTLDGVGLSIVERSVANRQGELKLLTLEEALRLPDDEIRPFLRSVLQLLAQERAAV